MNRFGSRCPNLSELSGRFVTDHAQNFFGRFPARLRDETSATFGLYEQIERRLSYIPEPEWPYFTNKIKQTVFGCDLSRHRFWEQLHDVFNQARGVLTLRTNFGGEEVRLVPGNDSATPDLAGQRRPRIHYR